MGERVDRDEHCCPPDVAGVGTYCRGTYECCDYGGGSGSAEYETVCHCAGQSEYGFWLPSLSSHKQKLNIATCRSWVRSAISPQSYDRCDGSDRQSWHGSPFWCGQNPHCATNCFVVGCGAPSMSLANCCNARKFIVISPLGVRRCSPCQSNCGRCCVLSSNR